MCIEIQTLHAKNKKRWRIEIIQSNFVHSYAQKDEKKSERERQSEE